MSCPWVTRGSQQGAPPLSWGSMRKEAQMFPSGSHFSVNHFQMLLVYLGTCQRLTDSSCLASCRYQLEPCSQKGNSICKHESQAETTRGMEQAEMCKTGTNSDLKNPGTRRGLRPGGETPKDFQSLSGTQQGRGKVSSQAL